MDTACVDSLYPGLPRPGPVAKLRWTVLFLYDLAEGWYRVNGLGDGSENSVEFHEAHDAQTVHNFVASLNQNSSGRDGSTAEIDVYGTVLLSRAADWAAMLMAFTTFGAKPSLLEPLIMGLATIGQLGAVRVPQPAV